MPALTGIGVLVTRPEQQATPLCQLLESAGATVVRLPAMRIEPSANPQAMIRALGPMQAFDLIIFTSGNAVKFGAALLDANSRSAIAAIGPATARALAQRGLSAAATPSAGFDSESLLTHPALARISDKRVLIIKGKEGRNLLQQQLTQRGANVVVAEVYERIPASINPQQLAALTARFASHSIDLVTVTSVDVARCLLALADPSLRLAFERVPWLVPSARVAAAVRELGVNAALIQAESATDQALVAAILRWRSSESCA